MYRSEKSRISGTDKTQRVYINGPSLLYADYSENGDVLLNLRSHILCNAFRNPNQVADFLLSQLDDGVKCTVRVLHEEGQLVEVHFMRVEAVLERAVRGLSLREQGPESLCRVSRACTFHKRTT